MKNVTCPFPPAVVAMVKGNAYGHGAVPVARHLKAVGVERLGVATTEEGAQLRSAGVTGPIHVFGKHGGKFNLLQRRQVF